MKRAIAEHILRGADQGLSQAAELGASPVAAFTTEIRRRKLGALPSR